MTPRGERQEGGKVSCSILTIRGSSETELFMHREAEHARAAPELTAHRLLLAFQLS